MKRIFTFLLALTMLWSMVPTTGFSAQAQDFDIAEDTWHEDVIPPEDTGALPEAAESAEEIAPQLPEMAEQITESTMPDNRLPPPPVPVSGILSENITWSIDEKYKLTLSGTGPIPAEITENRPWSQYTSFIEQLEIQPGITEIPSGAFRHCGMLKKLYLPDTLERIGQRITKMSVNIYITDLAAWCRIEFPEQDTVSHLYGALYLNEELVTSITIGAEIPCVPDYAFYEYDQLKEVIITPEAVSIGKYAFAECGMLKTIRVNGTPTFGEYAFLSSFSLDGRKVYLSDLQAWCGLEFPNKTANPAYYAAMYLNGEKLTQLNIPEGTPAINQYVFYIKDPTWTDTFIPASVTAIGKEAIHSPWNVHIADLAAWCQIQFEDETANPLYRHTAMYVNGQQVETLVIPEGVTTISDHAFHCVKPKYTALVLPDSLTEIGVKAFCSETDNNKRISSIRWPAGLQKLGEGAFYRALDLDSLQLPDSLTEISDSAFAVCKFAALTLPKNLKTIGSNAFAACRTPEVIRLPASLQEVDEGAFHSCPQLKRVEFTGSLQLLGNHAFKYCSGLEEIVFPENVENCGDEVFAKCTGLQNVTFPGGWDSYGEGMFRDCSSLMSVQFTENTTKIPAYAFENCSMYYVTLPGGVTAVESGAFKNCTKLHSVEFTGAAPTIAPDAFTGITVTASYPSEKTGWETVVNQTYEGNVSWHDPNTSIILEGVCGREKNIIWKLDGTTLYISSKGWAVFSSKDPMPWDPYRGIMEKVVLTGKIEVVASGIFANCPRLKEVELGEGLEEISYSMFKNCVSLEEIKLPDSVLDISNYAFEGCVSLKKVEMPSKLKWLRSDAFKNCTALRSITIKAAKVYMDMSAFEGCTNLEAVYFTCNLPDIPDIKNAYSADAPILKFYYPSGNKTWKASEVAKLNKSSANGMRLQCEKFSAMSAPKVKGGNDSATGKPMLTWNALEKADRYEIYRATKKSGKYALVDTVEQTSFVDTTATAGKTYYYKLKAISDESYARNSGYSSAVSASYTCSAPVISAQVDDATGKPQIRWETVDGAKKYEIHRATSATGKFKKLGTTGSLSYVDTKAEPGKVYYYKVKALGSKSTYNSSFSTVVSSFTVYSAPKLEGYTGDIYGDPQLEWKQVAKGVYYNIYRRVDGEEEFTFIKKTNTCAFRDGSAPLNQWCYYMVQTVSDDAQLNSAMSNAVAVFSGMSQPIVSGLNAPSGKPELLWHSVEGAVKYEIYRSTKEKSGYVLIDTVVSVNYIDTTAAVGKLYYYKVAAISENGESTQCKALKLFCICATPKIEAETDPISGKPVVTWEKVEGAKKYEIWRGVYGGKMKKLTTTTKLTYTDTKAETGKEYVYEVRALGSSGSYNSSRSGAKYALCICAQPKVTVKTDSKGVPVVSWKKVSGVSKYYVMYVDISDYLYSENIDQEAFQKYIENNLRSVELNSKKTSVTLTDTQLGRLYMVYVVAVHKDGAFNSIVSEPQIIDRCCAAPKIKTKSVDGYNGLTWSPVSGAEFYLVYRSNKKSGTYELLGSVGTTGFVDTGAAKGKTYYYKVTACTMHSEDTYITESEYSNVLKIKTKK